MEFFRGWFSAYAQGFCIAHPAEEDIRNYRLKEEHTYRVCDDIRLIAAAEGAMSVGAGEDGVLLAEAAALFHDVGRFPQYARYGTFRDSVSENHGEWGVRVLRDEGILGRLHERERSLILSAVRYHNAFSVPDLGDPEAVFLLKLIRDADKLDVWRVFAEYFGQPEEERAPAASLGLPGGRGISDGNLDRVASGDILPLGAVRTADDFKLMLLSWVYGLNFRASFGLVLERGFIGRIAGYLPPAEDAGEAVARLREFAEGKS
jgi:hypothetical protein